MALKTPTRPYYLGTPAQYKCLLVKLDTTEQMIQQSSTQARTPNCVWFDVRDRGFELAPAKIILPAGTTFYFIASEFAGYFYLACYFKDIGRFGCSCKEGKQGRDCRHIAMLGQLRNAQGLSL